MHDWGWCVVGSGGRLCMFCLTLLGRGSKLLPGDLGESLERSSVLSARVRWYGYAVEK